LCWSLTKSRCRRFRSRSLIGGGASCIEDEDAVPASLLFIKVVRRRFVIKTPTSCERSTRDSIEVYGFVLMVHVAWCLSVNASERCIQALNRVRSARKEARPALVVNG
jgi:hypothetical protein